MRKVDTLALEVSERDLDKVAEVTTTLVGTACCKRAGEGPTARILGMVELHPEGKEDLTGKYVYTGTMLYAFVPTRKEIQAIELSGPRAEGLLAWFNLQNIADWYTGCPTGLNPDLIKRRYSLTLEREDDSHISIGLLPRTNQDRTWFERARIVLHKDTFLIRQFWFQHPNGNETLWDFSQARKNIPLEEGIFGKPALPAGWKMVEVPRGPKP
jgi:hypothetical protein